MPRLRRLPVDGSFFLEYKRNWPDLSFRIMPGVDALEAQSVAHSGGVFATWMRSGLKAVHGLFVDRIAHIRVGDLSGTLQAPPILTGMLDSGRTFDTNGF